MNEWRDYTLNDFAIINPRESIAKGFKAKKIPMTVLGEFKRSIDSFEVSSYNGGTKFRNGDTLIARITPCLQNGKTAFVDILKDDEIAFGSTEFIVLRGKKGVSHDLFLFYLSISPILRQVAMKSMTGSSGRQRVQNDVLKSCVFNLPPLPEQKAIAHILGTLDDKIELNRQMNETLEAMAQALFKSWFVDFDPVLDNALAAGNSIPPALELKAAKRAKVAADKKLLAKNPALAALFPSSFEFNEELGKWVPEGWEVKKLQKLVTVKYGKDHKKLDEGEIPCYGSGGIMRFVGASLYESESVLIPRKGTLNNIIYINKPFWSVDTMFYTIMEEEKFAKYFFNTMKRLNFNELNEGSAVPSMTSLQLNSMDIILPSSLCLKYFDSIATKYYSKIEGNNLETKTLTQLRDTLLPQLIGGKVRVPEGAHLNTDESLTIRD